MQPPGSPTPSLYVRFGLGRRPAGDFWKRQTARSVRDPSTGNGGGVFDCVGAYWNIRWGSGTGPRSENTYYNDPRINILPSDLWPRERCTSTPISSQRQFLFALASLTQRPGNFSAFGADFFAAHLWNVTAWGCWPVTATETDETHQGPCGFRVCELQEEASGL